jgi:cobalamin biosynthesis protein CobT
MTPTYNARSGNKWSIPELITLQREYELLELTVQEISRRHKRSVFAILARLEIEGIIVAWATARGYMESNLPECGDEDSDEEADDDDDDDEDYKSSDNDSDEEDEDDESEKSDVNKLSDRVWNLETSVNEIGGIVKQMMELMSNDRHAKAQPKTKSTRAPLRSQKQSIED